MPFEHSGHQHLLDLFGLLGEVDEKTRTLVELEEGEFIAGIGASHKLAHGQACLQQRLVGQKLGRHELELPSALLPRDARFHDGESGTVERLATMPVNVAGYFRAELGIGAAARSLLSALEAARIPFSTISFDATANRQSFPFEDRAAGSA